MSQSIKELVEKAIKELIEENKIVIKDEAELEAIIDCKMNLHEYITATSEEINE